MKPKRLSFMWGGNPETPKPPLNYRIVYAVNSLLNFYERRATILKNGEIIEVAPLSEVESIHFPPDFPEMKCFYTDGLSSLLFTMKDKIKKDLYEKTIRHVGHPEGIEVLKSCGLFSLKPINLKNQEVVPRKVLENVLDSRMKLGDEKDVTLLRIEVAGQKEGKLTTHTFEMIDRYDELNSYTSMSKTTGFPASIAAQMLAAEIISRRGILFPENIFNAELFEPFIKELKKRGVVVKKKTKSKEQ
ncbi:saccharopine dehydrogenase family protein [Acidobacteriota bacterium]